MSDTNDQLAACCRHIQGCQRIIAAMHNEIAQLRLTDAEREAISLMADVAADPRGGAVLSGYEVAATLRGLLERMRGCGE